MFEKKVNMKPHLYI